MLTKRDIVKYYIAMFDRIPEKESVDFWYKEAVSNEWSETELVDSLLKSAVNVVNSTDSLKTLYPQYVDFNDKNVISVKNVIESVYKSLFDKDFKDDPEGIIDWTIKVITNEITLPQAIVAIEHFAEDVYNNKVDLSNYSDEDIEKIKEAVNTYESRVDFAYKVSQVIDNIKVDNNFLEVLSKSVELIHLKIDFQEACKYLEDNLNDVVKNNYETYKEELNDIFITHSDENNSYLLVDSSENLGFIDMPLYVEDNPEAHGEFLL